MIAPYRSAIAIMVVMVAIAGCAGSTGGESTPAPETGSETITTRLADTPGHGFYRIVDTEAGVICYYADHPGATGEALDCIPMGEVKYYEP